MTHAPILIGADTTLPDERFDQALEHHRQHNHAAAGKVYREILRENPSHVGAMQNLIDVCAHEGRRLEAIPLAERLGSLFPESADARHRLGWLYGESGLQACSCNNFFDFNKNPKYRAREKPQGTYK